MSIKKQHGFTILELMIATTIFSFILLIGSALIIQVSKMYYKGVNASRTQEITRSVIDDISRKAQFSAISVSSASNGTSRSYCVGNARYTFIPNRRVSSDGSPNSGPHGLWKDTYSGPCAALDITVPNPGGVNGQELLGDNMRVAEFCVGDKMVTPTPNQDYVCQSTTGDHDGSTSVAIRIVYGEDDLVRYNGGVAVGCLGDVSGSQWCASSQFETQVFGRLNAN